MRHTSKTWKQIKLNDQRLHKETFNLEQSIKRKKTKNQASLLL